MNIGFRNFGGYYPQVKPNSNEVKPEKTAENKPASNNTNEDKMLIDNGGFKIFKG